MIFVKDGISSSLNCSLINSDKKIELATQIINYIEPLYNCSGFCDLPLFYFTKPLEAGPPKFICKNAVLYEITKSLRLVGTVTWASALALSIIWCC